MYDEYYEKEDSPKKGFDMNKLLNIIIVVIAVIFVIVIIMWIAFPTREEVVPQSEVIVPSKYAEYEKKIVEAAEQYFNKNILDSSEKYLSVKTLGVSLPSNCSESSGVITSGNLHKPYLVCSDYETKIIENNKDSSIRLVGKSIYVLQTGTKFSDPGYVSDEPVTVSGNVGDIEGVYNIFYIGRNTNDTINRKIILTNDSSIKNILPTIELNGEEEIYVIKDSEYDDKGASAMDPQEGDITYKIKKIGKVDTSEVGEYKITYSVSNRNGFTTSITRTVTVISNIGEMEMTDEIAPSTKTTQNVTIKIKVLGENYAYSYLPTGEKITDTEFSYSAKENGIYHFWAYDTYGRYIEKKVTISNIDRITPTFTCDANVYGNHVDVIVTSISKPISKYKFIINNEESNFLEQTSYVKNTNNFVSAKVEVIDEAGNHSVNECTAVKKDPTIGNNKIKYYNYDGAEYVIANTQNDLSEFVNQTRGKISQSVFSDENDPNYRCTSACLGFSQYHAGFLQEGNIYNMDALSACNYNLIKGMTHSFYQTKEGALAKIYEEITNGRVCVLQVTANQARNSRHFVLVVGFKRDKYSSSELRQEDLLTIDSWTGNFCTLSEADLSKRAMFNRSNEGYRIDYFS